MYLKSFDDFFPHQAQLDKCHIIIDDDEEPALNGIFELIDYYCPNPDCECHRVTIAIVDKFSRVCATIIYGWESKAFYSQYGDDPHVAEHLPRGYLDLENPQSAHAEDFLVSFSFMTQDQNFADRFKKRYSLFRNKVFSKQRSKNPKVVPFKAKKRA